MTMLRRRAFSLSSADEGSISLSVGYATTGQHHYRRRIVDGIEGLNVDDHGSDDIRRLISHRFASRRYILDAEQRHIGGHYQRH